jgi:hypothetical protein
MSITCDECETSVHDKEEFKFLFKRSDGVKTYDFSLSLCCRCFDNKFSIRRYAKLCAKDSQLDNNQSSSKGLCCVCDRQINKNKEQHHLIRCFDHKVALEIAYCASCYADDVGI